MKKLLIALLILAPFITFGATLVAKEYKLWDNFASINITGNNLTTFIKIDDPKDENVKCYAAVSNAYTDKAFLSGFSCVKVK
jgi:hypothetical protein